MIVTEHEGVVEHLVGLGHCAGQVAFSFYEPKMGKKGHQGRPCGTSKSAV